MHWDLVYCSLLGLSFWGLLRAWFSKGFLSPSRKAKFATAFGLIVLVAGGIAHRLYGFNPDFTSWTNWLLAVIGPFLLAIFTARRDRSRLVEIHAKTWLNVNGLSATRTDWILRYALRDWKPIMNGASDVEGWASAIGEISHKTSESGFYMTLAILKSLSAKIHDIEDFQAYANALVTAYTRLGDALAGYVIGEAIPCMRDAVNAPADLLDKKLWLAGLNRRLAQISRGMPDWKGKVLDVRTEEGGQLAAQFPNVFELVDNLPDQVR